MIIKTRGASMGTLLKVQVIRYVDGNGRRVLKGTSGARTIKEKSTKWYGQYKDADGKRRRVPLCSDKVAARQMLAALERDAERGRAGVVDRHAAHRKAPIQDHVADYATHLANKGVSPKHQSETLRRLKAVLNDAGFRTLGDLNPEAVERFLARLADRGAGSRTRNTYLSSIKAFSRWCLKTRRLGEDALACLSPASGKVRRQRRALTDGELTRLLQVARERPLLEAMTIRTGKLRGQAVGRIQPKVRERLERLGWERSLMYKMMVWTGLRRGELEALAVRDLTLTGPRPCLTLPGSVTKNREVASLPLRGDLVSDLVEWLQATGKTGTDLVFRVPVELVKILKRDLALAGIPYRDEHGRTIDVHALRHTTATSLSKAKVSPRIAQRFMRHSDIKLTMQTYTDHRQLDEAEALAALPQLLLTTEADEMPPTDEGNTGVE
jgi:integrase